VLGLARRSWREDAYRGFRWRNWIKDTDVKLGDPGEPCIAHVEGCDRKDPLQIVGDCVLKVEWGAGAVAGIMRLAKGLRDVRFSPITRAHFTEAYLQGYDAANAGVELVLRGGAFSKEISMRQEPVCEGAAHQFAPGATPGNFCACGQTVWIQRPSPAVKSEPGPRTVDEPLQKGD
jgi:hypothetical protein